MKENKFRITKKGIIYFLLLVIMFMTGFSLAYWQKNFTQTGVNLNTYDCFNIEYSENVEGITQLKGFPQTDSDGLQNDPYIVTITNTCKTYSTYQVAYNVMSDSTLEDKYVKIGINNEAKLLTEYSRIEPTVEDASRAYIIKSGGLKYNQKVTLNFRAWMDYNTTEEQGENTIFKSKITIETVAAFMPKLADLIKDTKIVTTGDGLYKTQGVSITKDGKPTYYYRGTNVDNYVSLNNQLYRIIRLNEDESIRLMAVGQANYSAFYNPDGSSTYYSDPDVSIGIVSGALNSWYNNYIAGSEYEQFVLQDGEFCNDTSVNDYGVYGARARRAAGTMIFSCPVETLKLKVGLITVDEFDFSGGTNSYLYGNTYWTMTPFDATNVYFINTTNTGGVGYRGANTANPAVYAVINLDKNVRVNGEGTSSSPYVVELEVE